MKLPRELTARFKKELMGDKKVIAVLVFGSYIREKGRKSHYKDIDICLVLDKRYPDSKMFDMRLKYASLLPDKFDINLFQQLPLYIRSKILKEGKVIMCKDEPLLYDIAFLTIKEFDDFKEIYRSYIKNALR